MSENIALIFAAFVLFSFLAGFCVGFKAGIIDREENQ
jgi:hypothetical protein